MIFSLVFALSRQKTSITGHELERQNFALCYRLRARHGSALDAEYILPVESGDDEIPREDWVALITVQ
jgi:hypothetical protein